MNALPADIKTWRCKTCAEGAFFLVDSLLGMRTHPTDGAQYLVHWMGYSHEHNTWENEEKIHAYLVAEYKKRNRHSAVASERRASEAREENAALDHIEPQPLEMILQTTAPQPQQPENDPNSINSINTINSINSINTMAQQQPKAEAEVSLLMYFANYPQVNQKRYVEAPRTPKRRPSQKMPSAPRKKRRRRQPPFKCPDCKKYVPSAFSQVHDCARPLKRTETVSVRLWENEEWDGAQWCNFGSSDEQRIHTPLLDLL
jgi:hypothetical protein